MDAERILSVPVMIHVFTEETRELYPELLKKSHVKRVSLCASKAPADNDFEPFAFKDLNLYVYAADENGAMGVALLNVFEDEVLHPVIRLNREYRELRCLNRSGELKGDQVVLSTIEPYGYAAFEVR